MNWINLLNSEEVSDHQQSWGYVDGPWKEPEPPLLVAADLGKLFDILCYINIGLTIYNFSGNSGYDEADWLRKQHGITYASVHREESNPNGIIEFKDMTSSLSPLCQPSQYPSKNLRIVT